MTYDDENLFFLSSYAYFFITTLLKNFFYGIRSSSGLYFHYFYMLVHVIFMH